LGIISTLVEMIFTVVLLPLIPPVVFIIKYLAWYIGLILPIFMSIFNAVNWVFEKIGSFLFPFLEKFRDWVHAGWDKLLGWITKIDWKSIWDTIKSWALLIWNGYVAYFTFVFNIFKPILSKIRAGLMEALKWLGAAAGWIIDILDTVWGWAKSFFSSILDFGWLKSIRDFVLDKLAWFLDLISGIDFKWFGGKVFSDAGTTSDAIRKWLADQTSTSGLGTSKSESLGSIGAPTVNISVVDGDLQEHQEIKISTQQANRNNEQDVVRIDGLASVLGNL